MKNNINYKLIGKRLRAMRKKCGYTQERLAELAEISPQHCSGIETGGAKVSLSTLVQLCNVLGATPDEILMDSVSHAAPVFSKNVAEVFSDCSPDETFLMLSQADNLKKALRLKNSSIQEKEC